MIKSYLMYHNIRSNSPLVFAKHLMIQAIGHSLGRKSVNLIQPRAVHHNMYIALIGKSGKSLKSTAQEEIMNPIIPYEHIGLKNFSPEGLLRELQDQESMICPLGEFSTLLRGIAKGGHMANFKEISNDLFGCPNRYDKRLTDKSNSYNIIKPYLSMSTTCTEDELFPNLLPDMVHGGFLPRWIMIKGEPPKYRRRGLLPENIDNIEMFFKAVLKKCYLLFIRNPIKFRLTDDGFDAYDDITRDLFENDEWDEVQPFVARYSNYIISYADILTVSDWLEKEVLQTSKLSSLSNLSLLSTLSKLSYKTIDSRLKGSLDNLCTLGNSVNSEQIKRAWLLLKPSLQYAKEISMFIDEDFYILKVLKVLNEHPVVDWSDALRKSKMSGKKFLESVSTLQDRKQLIVDTITTGEGKAKKDKRVIRRVKEV